LSGSLFSSWILLAQEAGKVAQEAGKEAEQAPSGPNFLLPLIAIFFLFYFLILRPQKNKEQAMKSMIENLKEKDRVVTIGGIYGVVTNIQRDQEMITLRIDESTGAKIRVGASAIARVVVDDEAKKSE
jgi:preprotein translocase subunit YajC